MNGGPEPMRRAVRLWRGVLIGLVALLVFHLLRTHVAERYLVPTGSMEPTLHGDRQHGDLVLVDKAGWIRSHDSRDLQRFDLVVVRDGNGARDHLVKRVVSLGDEVVAIRDGDLFVRPLAGGEFTRVQKHPGQHRDLRVTFFVHPGAPDCDPRSYLAGEAVDAHGAIRMPMGAPTLEDVAVPFAAERDRRAAGRGPAGWRPPGWSLRNTVPVDVSFFDAAGQRIAVGRGFARDVGIEVAVRIDSTCAGVLFALELGPRLLVVAYGRDGAGQLFADGEGALAIHGRPLPAGEKTLAFGHLDGRLFLEVDEETVLLRDVPPPEAMEAAAGWPENVLHFAIAGRGPEAPVSRVRLFHDVHYRPEAVAFADDTYRVERHEVFLLGDNSTYSVDSRRRGAFPADSIVGRPLAVIGPLRRMRWLSR